MTQLSMLPEEREEQVVAPVGFGYHAEFLTAREEADLLGRVDGSEWLGDLSRRVQHFGYKYDYSHRRLDESAHIGPLPEWLAVLACKVGGVASGEAGRLLDVQRPFDQAIVNEYEPGQGIAPHVDRDCFGPVVATVSLASAVNMDFFCAETGDGYTHRLEPRSLVLLCGDARWRWRHGIAKRRTDIWDGQKIARQRRVSVTFRTIASLASARPASAPNRS